MDAPRKAAQGGSDFIRGVHFFGSASPLNFWDSFLKSEIEAAFEQFRSDGFNTIVLLVPWAQFQPEITPVAYQQRMLARLDAIFAVANRLQLGVILRLGYLWEAMPVVDSTYDRFHDYPVREEVRFAWQAFLRFFKDYADKQQNFQFAFLSWEDFYWPILRGWSSGPVGKRVERARIGGFRDYARKRFTIPGLKQVYGVSISTWKELAIPLAEEPLYEQYLKFYETEILDRICSSSAEVFPDIRMELRVDPEWLVTLSGKRKFYHWSMNFSGAATKVVYYHANIAKSHTDVLSGDAAVMHLRDLLATYGRMHELGEARPFIDQFNFFDDTYKLWGRIDEGAIPDFVDRSLEVLKQYSSGYAIWGYQDWPKDVVYNGGFELDDTGWEFSAGAKIAASAAKPGCKVLELPTGAGIGQRKISLKLPEQDSRHVSVLACAPRGAATLSIALAGVAQKVSIAGDEEHEYVVEFSAGELKDLQLKCLDGEITLSRVRLYDRFYSQGFRTREGNERPAVRAFRALNSAFRDHERTGAAVSGE